MPRDTLFDDATSEVGIDEAALGALYRTTQGIVGEAFLPHESRKASRLENPHHAPITLSSIQITTQGVVFQDPGYPICTPVYSVRKH